MQTPNSRVLHATVADRLVAGLGQDGQPLAKLVESEGFDNVLFGASVLAADVAAGLAARLDAGLNWDLVDLELQDGKLVGKRPALGDSVIAEVGWKSEPRLARTINIFARRAAVGVAAAYGDGIVRLVSDTVRGWDAVTVTNRLEQAVGRDLQYIRVNGTLVGGLVGLAIHIVDRLL